MGGKRLGGWCPKDSDCRPNARAVCWHQQPQDLITEAVPDTRGLSLASADLAIPNSLIKPNVAARHFG